MILQNKPPADDFTATDILQMIPNLQMNPHLPQVIPNFLEINHRANLLQIGKCCDYEYTKV